MSIQTPQGKAFTSHSLRQYKQAQQKIVMCTAYDYHAARIARQAGIDAILVGDSLGMAVLGHRSTLPVTMEDMISATAAVVRGADGGFVIADMPFMSYQASYSEGMTNAGRLIKEGGASAVKVEGATEDTLSLIEGLVGAGIPVVAHLGLTPQSVLALGGYSVQAKESDAITKLMLDARSVQEAGACCLVLECIPAEVGSVISSQLVIPTIGIGAGHGCDGEIQVYHDLLGFGDFKPRHAKRYLEAEELFTQALETYANEVRTGEFPGEPQTTHVDLSLVKAATQTFDRICQLEEEERTFLEGSFGRDDNGYE